MRYNVCHNFHIKTILISKQRFYYFDDLKLFKKLDFALKLSQITKGERSMYIKKETKK